MSIVDQLEYQVHRVVVCKECQCINGFSFWDGMGEWGSKTKGKLLFDYISIGLVDIFGVM